MWKMPLGLFAILFGILAAMPAFSATFYGVVLDSESNRPLAEVKVMTLPSGEAITDADGRFQITGMETRTVKLTFTYLGYETLEREVSFDGQGQEIPSPEGDIRFVALDVISADQLSAIEVNKSLTPEMDGDAIGGTVNLITLAAQDTAASLCASLAGGYNAEMVTNVPGFGARIGFQASEVFEMGLEIA